MSFLKAIFDDPKALETLGDGPRIQARAAGADFFFCDVENDGRISVEHPDGRVSTPHEPNKIRLKANAR